MTSAAPVPATEEARAGTVAGPSSSPTEGARSEERRLGLVLIEVTSATGSGSLEPAQLTAARRRLGRHLRGRDVVTLIGSSLFAVVVELFDPVHLELIRERMLIVLTAATSPEQGRPLARAVSVSAPAGGPETSQRLLRQAAARLGFVIVAAPSTQAVLGPDDHLGAGAPGQ